MPSAVTLLSAPRTMDSADITCHRRVCHIVLMLLREHLKGPRVLCPIFLARQSQVELEIAPTAALAGKKADAKLKKI